MHPSVKCATPVIVFIELDDLRMPNISQKTKQCAGSILFPSQQVYHKY